MRKDGSFGVSVDGGTYVWTCADVPVQGEDGAVDRAGWVCPDVPGLSVHYDNRAPCDRFDSNLSSTCNLTHSASGFSLGCTRMAHAKMARAAVYLHRSGCADWTDKQQAVVHSIGLLTKEQRGVFDAMRTHCYTTPVPVPVLLEQHGDLWVYSKALVDKLRSVATAHAVCIAGVEYTMPDGSALRHMSRYIAACKDVNPLILAGHDTDTDTVNVLCIHKTGEASVHVSVIPKTTPSA